MPNARRPGILMIEGVFTRVYAATLLVFGVMYAFVVPPFQGPDEIVHFVRALSVSQGHCVAPSYINVPETYVRDSTIFHPSMWDGDPMVAKGLLKGEILAHLPSVPLGKDVPIASVFSIDAYGCILYFPAGLALAISHPFHLSLIVNLFLTRVATLIASLAVLIVGFTIIPFGKPLYIFISLLPTFMSQMASPSGDSLTNSISLFAIASILRLSSYDQTKRLSTIETAGLVALAGALALAKIDAILIPLVLLIPKSRFGGSARKAVTFFGLLFVSFATLSVWLKLNEHITKMAVASRLAGLDEDVGQNVAYAGTHLLTVARIFAAMTKSYGNDWLTGIIGTFGWLVTSLPAWAVGGALTLLAYFSWRVRWPAGPPLWSRLLCVAIACCGGAVMLGLDYSYEMTRTNLSEIMKGRGVLAITGMQGRYLLPFVLPLGLALGTASADPDADISERVLALLAGVVLNVLGIITIARYFYR